MAATTATPRFSNAGLGSRSQNNITFQTRATREWDVLVTDPANDDESTAVLAAGIPILRQAHPSQPWLRCVDVYARRMTPTHFLVTAEYDSPIGLTGSPDQNDNPLNQPPDIKWGTVAEDDAVDEDADGKPICTVVGEPFDPPIRLTRRDLLLRYTRNLSQFDPRVIVPYTDYGGAVSSDTVLGQPAGTVRVNDIQADEIFDNDLHYYRVYLELQFRRGAPRTTDEKAFWRRVRAQGYYVNVEFFEATLVFPAQVNGQRATSPQLHDKETGEQLPFDPEAGLWPEAQWYEFKVHNEMPISDLGVL